MDFKKLGIMIAAMSMNMNREQFATARIKKPFSFSYSLIETWVQGELLGIAESEGVVDAKFTNIGGSNSLFRQNMRLDVDIAGGNINNFFSNHFSFDYVMDNDSRIVWCSDEDVVSCPAKQVPNAMSIFFDSDDNVIMLYLHHQYKGIHIELSGSPKPILPENLWRSRKWTHLCSFKWSHPVSRCRAAFLLSE